MSQLSFSYEALYSSMSGTAKLFSVGTDNFHVTLVSVFDGLNKAKHRLNKTIGLFNLADKARTESRKFSIACIIRGLLPLEGRVAHDKCCYFLKEYTSLVESLLRRGKKINMVLVLWFLKMRARVREIFFLLRIFYQLANIDLVLKDRLCDKFET